MSGFYRMQEFAELAGVTVKALRHYERLGLLIPGRTDRGYRLYAERDLERLEQVLALKFLGVPLRQIKTVLEQPTPELANTLRFCREALEERQQLLSRTVRAIRVAEQVLESGGPAAASILKQLLEVIGMHDDIAAMKKYYSTEDAWNRARRYYEEGPAPEWQELYRDIRAVLGEDPAGDRAQALADRWLQLSVRAYQGEPDLQTPSPAAWMDRENWPPSMRRRLAEFNLEEVHDFVEQAALSSRKKYFSEDAWIRWVEIRNDPAKLSVFWQSRVDLFREIESSRHEDPAGARGRTLALRWSAHLDAASGGDPAVKVGLMKTWADRRNWRATLRWVEEGLCMISGEQFDAAADFLDRVVAAS